MCRVDVGIPEGLTASDRSKQVRYYVGMTENEYDELCSVFRQGFILCFKEDAKGRLHSEKMFFSLGEYFALCSLSSCLVGEIKLLEKLPAP